MCLTLLLLYLSSPARACPVTPPPALLLSPGIETILPPGFALRFDGDADPACLRLLDSSGRLLDLQAVGTSLYLAPTELPAGRYQLERADAAGWTTHEIIVDPQLDRSPPRHSRLAQIAIETRWVPERLTPSGGLAGYRAHRFITAHFSLAASTSAGWLIEVSDAEQTVIGRLPLGSTQRDDQITWDAGRLDSQTRPGPCLSLVLFDPSHQPIQHQDVGCDGSAQPHLPTG